MRGETGVNGFFNDRWFSNGETMEVDYSNGSEREGEMVGFFIDDKRRFVEIFLISLKVSSKNRLIGSKSKPKRSDWKCKRIALSEMNGLLC